MSPRSHGRAVAGSLAPGYLVHRFPSTVWPYCLISGAAYKLPSFSSLSGDFFKSKHIGHMTCHTSKPSWNEMHAFHLSPSQALTAEDPFSFLILEDRPTLKECKLMFQSSAIKIIPHPLSTF